MILIANSNLLYVIKTLIENIKSSNINSIYLMG